MDFMFSQSLFNGNISEWDVSNVKDMYNMFYESSFDQQLCWDVSKKINYEMFTKAKGCIKKNCCTKCDKKLLC